MERTSSMLDEIASKSEHKSKEGDQVMKKKYITLNEVKPVENINKNLQSFLGMSTTKKEVLPSHQL